MPTNKLDNQNANPPPPTDEEENNEANAAPDTKADAKFAPTPQVTTNPGIKNY